MLELYTNSTDINIFITTAKAMGLETEIIWKRPNLCRISRGSTHLLIHKNALSLTSTVHRRMVWDKYLTLRLFEKAGVPCPRATLFRTHQEKDILDYAAAHRPVVIKPRTGSLERGVCVNPQDDEAVLSAVQQIKGLRRGFHFVQVESLIEGSDYRILLYGGELMGIVKWVPPYVTGNGKKTLKELVEIKSNYRVANLMTAIIAEPSVIERQGFDFEAVLPEGVSCSVNSTSRYAVGGETLRVDPSAVHPDNLKICLRAAEATFLNFSGVDLISKDIGISCFKNGAAINEINACPQIFAHYFADGSEDTREAQNVLKKYFQLPSFGTPRDVAGAAASQLLYGKSAETVYSSPMTSLSDPSESAERAGGFAEPVHTIIAGGDVMLARDIPGQVAETGVGAPLRGVRPLLDRADIALVNLECVLSGKGDFFDKGERRPYFYRCPPAMVNVLAEAGISMVTTANNHAMDFGPEALADQSRILNEAGIAYTGSGANPGQAAQPVFFRAGDLVVAILSFATDLPRFAAGEGKWGIFNVSLGQETLDRLRPAIEAARDCADLVIVSPHWGANWRENPTEEIRELARGLIDLGVDAIIGHSAHLLQGIEVYRGKPIVYDMGTALFDRVQQNRMRHSALFEMIFGRRGLERLVVHPVELESGQVRLANDEEGGKTRRLIQEMSRLLDPGIEFRENANALELHLMAQGITGRKREPESLHGKNIVRPTNHESGSLNEANIFLPDLPPGIDPGLSVDLGRGLKVLGARFPERGRAGFGFVLEVFFRYPDTEGRRWRASIRGIDPRTGTDFRYRHPVAEGMWVPKGWRDERIINDRVVVRPPTNLAPARYELYWNLVDADTGNLRKTSSDDPRVRNNWLHLGAIDLTKDAPRAVAGMSHAGISNANIRTLSRSISFLGLNVLDISEAEFVYDISIPKSTDIVQVRSPSIDLVSQAHEKDFLFKPSRLLWIMEIPPTADEYFVQLSSKQRKNVKRSIRSFQSASLTLRFEEHLNFQSYRVWLELYRKVIGGMNIGNLVATESFFNKTKDKLVGIFLQDSHNNLCGGTIAQLHSDDMFVCKFGVIHPNYRHLDLTRYLDFEAMQLARRIGCSMFSLGTDTNLYGYHLSIGLYLYKKAFGLHPVPRQVIDPLSIDVLQKITNFKKFSEQCFILSYGGNNKFVGNLFCKKVPDKTSLEMYTAPFLERLRIIQVESDEYSVVPKGMILHDIVL